MSDKINSFSFNLYQELKDEPGNLFFSPYGVYTALSMAYAGASGETARQMAGTLNLGPSADKDHQELGRLINQLNTPKESYKLTAANALWGQRGYKFLKPFLSILKDRYRSELNQADFMRNPEESRKTINRWVEKQTDKKIKDLLVPASVNKLTRLILINAIYFKAAWHEKFEKEATRDEAFYLSSDEKTIVPMMKQTEEFEYYENAKLQMLQLPYKHYDLAMLIILPKERAGLASLEQNLKSEELNRWLKELERKEVIISLPRFKTTSTFSLQDILPVMGMKDAFSVDNADFSGMTGKRDIFISDVIHKAYVDVNEDGTEAAAATAVLMAESMAPRPEEPKVFKADHPFIFLIRDNNSGTILFFGRIVNPSI
ncbi:MAG: serpin family protein [Candidatus Margulisbacteria bacterium]|nr:serpin family protein [Candidatus Margulisiibacteriota bacterium]